MGKKKDNGNGTTAIATRDAEPLPDYLRHDGAPVGTENKGESKVTPRLKQVQSMSDEELLDEFGAGAVLIGDAQTLVCEPEGSFVAVPVYQFPSWEVWKDVKDKSSDNPVEAMSTDPDSEIAQRAKARHDEPYGESGYVRTWIESMNYIVEIQDGPCAGEIAMMSYSRGSAKVGRRLKGYIQRSGADIYAHRIEFFPDKARNDKGHWHVVNFRTAKPAWVSQDDAARLADVYRELDAAYRSGAIGAKVDPEPTPA